MSISEEEQAAQSGNRRHTLNLTLFQQLISSAPQLGATFSPPISINIDQNGAGDYYYFSDNNEDNINRSAAAIWRPASSSGVTGNHQQTHTLFELLTSSPAPEDESSLLSSESVRNYLLIFAYSLIVLLSLFGNGLLMPVMLNRTSARTATNLLIVNLAVADLLLTLFNIPINIVRFVSRDWPFGLAICKLTPFIQSLSAHCSSITMMMIAYERYQRLMGRNPVIALWYYLKHIFYQLFTCWCRSGSRHFVGACLRGNRHASEHASAESKNNKLQDNCHNLQQQQQQPKQPNHGLHQYKKGRSTWNAMLGTKIFYIWLVSSALSLPHGYFSVISRHTFFIQPMIRCRTSYPNDRVRLLMIVSTPLTQFWLPVGLTTLFYARIGRFLWRKSEPIGAVSEGRRVSLLRRKRNRVKMLIWVVAIFAACWLPLHIYVTLHDLRLIEDSGLVIFFTFHWLAMSSVCWNPYIYCWLNEAFRRKTITYLRVFAPIRRQISRLFNFCCCCCCYCCGRRRICNSENRNSSSASSALPQSALNQRQRSKQSKKSNCDDESSVESPDKATTTTMINMNQIITLPSAKRISLNDELANNANSICDNQLSPPNDQNIDDTHHEVKQNETSLSHQLPLHQERSERSDEPKSSSTTLLLSQTNITPTCALANTPTSPTPMPLFDTITNNYSTTGTMVRNGDDDHTIAIEMDARFGAKSTAQANRSSTPKRTQEFI